MKVAHIVPPHGLWLLHGRSYHLTIAPRLAESVKMREFYRDRHQMGDFIIVDNGEVEFVYSHETSERMGWKDIVAVADLVGADEICLPDIFRDCEATIRAVEAVWETVPPRRCMVIPQGESVGEWMHCCSTLLGRFGGIRSVGIPKHMERFGRVEVLDEVVKVGWHREHDFHLLGVWDDPMTEIRDAVCFHPWVRGIDTGIAVAYAQQGQTVNHYAGKHVGLDWEAKFDDRAAQHNIMILEDWAGGK